MAQPEIVVRDFFHDDDPVVDLLPALRRAVASLHSHGQGRLILPKGVFHLRPDSAQEIALSIANNEPGFKFVGVRLESLRNVEIVGNETSLIIHDRLIPFYLNDCSGVVLRNFKIDWAQPFYGQAPVLSSSAGEIIAHLDRTIPWDAIRGRLTFRGEGWTAPLEHVFEIDAELKRPALGSHDNCGAGWLMQWHAEDIGNDRVRLTGNFPHAPRAGNILVLRPGEQRDAPAIVLHRCKEVSLQNIDIHHASGMGVIAQRCNGVELKRVRVLPSGDRVFSTTVDASHFVGCSGNIVIEDCHFEGQLDDPANIHGIYAKVESKLAAHTLRARLVHPQQRGFQFAAPGDLLSLVRSANLTDYWQARLVAIGHANRQWFDLTFDTPLPADLRLGDGLDNLDWQPFVRISRCWMGGNRARGPLLGSRIGTLIEDNHFATPGAAIHSGPECTFWFESAPVSNVTIRRNFFDECAHEPAWGSAPINLDPVVTDPASPSLPLQRNVVIEDNTFKTLNGACIRARHVENLTIRRNKIIPTLRPEAKILKSLPACDLEHCLGQLEIEEPVLT